MRQPVLAMHKDGHITPLPGHDPRINLCERNVFGKGSRSAWGKEVGSFPGASALVTGHSHEAKDVVSSTDNGKWVIK
jgi:hypothetical protein